MCDEVLIQLRRRSGPPLLTRIDAADLDLVGQHTWSALVMPHTTYARTEIRVEGRATSLYLHQLLLGCSGADHIDGNGLNNRRANLRVATSEQNSANRAPLSGRSSQYKGVGWHRHRGTWQAYITVHGQQRHLGYFTAEEDAALAYDSAALATWGEWVKVNFTRAVV